MAFLIKKNNVFSRINMTGGLEQSATLLTVEDGSIFPEQGDFLITIWNKDSYPNPSDDSNMEIIRATSRSGNDITIERAQEGTSDVAHADSSAVEMLITAGVFNEALDQNLKTTDSPFFRSVFIDDGIDSDSEEITQEKVSNWNTAFGWGNHATEGYLKEETDPVFSSWEYKSTVENNASNWSTAYNWGDHAAQGYVKNLTGFSSDDLEEGLLNKYDQIVSLTAGLNITIDGSYPNFTITASGTGGTTEHSELSELLWSESGHSIDSDLFMDSHRIILSVRASSSTPPVGQIYLYAKESSDSNAPSRLYYIGDDGSEIEVGSGGGEGQVSSVFGRIGAILAQQNDYSWAQIDKSTSDIADIATRSHTSLTDVGTTTHANIDLHIGSSSNPHSVTAAQVSAVALAGDETIQGLKTFATLPQSSDIPSDDSDLVTKSYVDSFSQGLLPKDSCIAATVENITLANEQTIDGVNVVAGDRVLVKEQSNSAQNGIYVVVHAGAWTRATDYDSDEEVREGTYTYIINGDTLQNTQWVQYQIDPVVGVDALNFRPLPAPTEYFASNGLTLSEKNFKLGGQLSENTDITFNAYNVNFNLNSTGVFNIQDLGVNRLQVNAEGLVGIGSSALAGSQAYILPGSSSLKGLTVRQASGQTAYLMDWQNSSGTVLGRIDEEGFLRVEQTVDQTTKNSGHFYQIPRTLKSYTSGTNDIVQSTAWVAFKLDLSSESSTSYIRSIVVRPKVDVAVSNPTATLTMYLYTDVDNTPGTSLATGTAYRMGQITTAYSTRYWNLTYDAAPAVYWIILRWSAAPGGATLSYQGNASISGECQTSSNGTTWTGTDEGRPRYYLYGRTGTAVYGRSDSGTGVYGYSINGYALYGISENGNAIYGSASRGYGGYFISTYSYGVYANSTYGTAVYGITTSGSGIYGTSSTGTGVYGVTTSGTAIYGISTTGTGIYATTDTGVGIYVACNNAVGNASQQMMRLRRLTSSTPEDGLASHITWELENSNNSAVEASRWSVTAQNVGASVFSSTVSFMSRVNNVLATRLQINELGYTEIVGNNTGAANNVVLRFKDTDTTSQENQNIGRIEFYSSDASTPGAGVKAYFAGVSEGTAPGAYLTFATDQVTGTPVERMRIKSDGTITINKYTENGFVKTSDSNGTLIIDQNVYLTPSDALLLDQSVLSEPQTVFGGSPFFSEGITANGIYNVTTGEEEEGILNACLAIWGNRDDIEQKSFVQIYDPNQNSSLNVVVAGELLPENIVKSTQYTFIGDITCTDYDDTGSNGKITAREFVGDATLDYANIETLYGQTTFSHSLAGENITGGSIWQKLGNEFTFKDLSPANPGRCMDMHENLLFLGTYQDKVNNTATVIIYDATDRLNPVRLSPTDITGLPQGTIGCKSVRYYDGYLYCSWDGNNYNTLRIIDVSDPENPIVVAGEELDLGTAGGGSSVDIDEVNDILYIGCLSAVFKIDISDPTTPVILDNISGLMTHGTLWTCKYSNGYVYTTGRSSADPAEQTQLYVIDVSGSEMVLIENSNQLYFNGTWAIYVEDDYIYMANGLSFANDDNNKFAIVDISDPESPVVVSELFLSESPCSYVRKVGDIVYVSNWALVSPPDYNPAIFAINVADPENPYVIGQTTAPDMPLSLCPADGGQYLYIAFAPFSREVPFFGVMESKGMYAHYGAFSRLNVGTESAIEYSFPETDGTVDQVLCTNGEGVVSWGNYVKTDQTSAQTVANGQLAFELGIALGDGSSDTQDLFRILDGSETESQPIFQWRPNYESSGFGGFSFYSPGSNNNVALPCIGNAEVIVAAFTTSPNHNSSFILYDNATGDSEDARLWAITKEGGSSDEDKNKLSIVYTDQDGGFTGSTPYLSMTTYGKVSFFNALVGEYETDEVGIGMLSLINKTGEGSWTGLGLNCVVVTNNPDGPNYLMQLQRNALTKFSVSELGHAYCDDGISVKEGLTSGIYIGERDAIDSWAIRNNDASLDIALMSDSLGYDTKISVQSELVSMLYDLEVSGSGTFESVSETTPTLFKLNQSEEQQDIIPVAGTTISITTYDVFPTLAPGAFVVPAIAFTNSNAVGFSPYGGAMRGGVLGYSYDGYGAMMGVVHDLEASQVGIFEYNPSANTLDLGINNSDASFNFGCMEDPSGEYFPVLGGKTSSGSTSLFFDTLLGLWDSQGNGSVGITGVSQDFSTVSFILTWNSVTEQLAYSGFGGYTINTTDYTPGTTSLPLTLAFSALGKGSDNDGLRINFRHRSDAGTFGTGYTAGYIDCIQTDASAAELNSYLAFGGYTSETSEESEEWLKLDKTEALFGKKLNATAGDGSKIGNATEYFTFNNVDFGAGGSVPILLSVNSDFVLGANIGAIGDYLVIYDYADAGQAVLAFAMSGLASTCAFTFDGTDLRLDTTLRPSDDDAYALGTDTARYSDVFGETIHAGQLKTDVTSARDLEVTCGSEKTLLLSTVVWDDIQFATSTGKIPSSNVPDFDTFTTNTKEYKFDVDDFIYLEANEMAHWWKEGTTVYPHVHVALNGANASGSSQYVKFTIFFAYADANEVWTETSDTVEIEIPTGSADLTHFLGGGTGVALPNNLIGTQVKVTLKRIAATTGTEYPNHIFVTQTGLHCAKDTMGSRTISAK